MKTGDWVVFKRDVPVHFLGRPHGHACVFEIIPARAYGVTVRTLCPVHLRREDDDRQRADEILTRLGWRAYPEQLVLVWSSDEET